MSEKLKYIKNNSKDKLQINDLIKLGLYNLLLIILMGVGVGVCAVVISLLFAGKLYFSIFTTVGTGLFAAPAFTLIFHKINKNNAILITTVISGLFLLLSGHVALAFPITVLFGFIAEYYFRKGNEYLSYQCFTLGGIGTVIPLYFMKSSYIEHLQARGYSQEKVDFIMSNSSLEIFIIMIIATIFSTLLGTYISRKLYFKNFEKAGL
ncbi:MptD family putative ECF transporter S component [Gemella sp. GH3]|uniref:MptD family putative ECF transporter S component n=1 Tax=unclassified Gemella TaxID=2624949 RepID=UPI0015D05832|nr:MULTISPECIES: MptD family putative ECF transporter S component [unclassified Gemella]MBF0714146.1 MptD family putative ECF transporter S component [Gemella sp. GH3.1]NYS51098.1 MptD family putative ECF transporter S component [Gemella sp. GH3]